MQTDSSDASPHPRLSTSAADPTGAKHLERHSVGNVKMPDKSSTSNNPYKEKYKKLSQTVKIMFLSIKRRLLKEDPDCAKALKDTIPFDEDDEVIIRKDTLLLAQYIKKMSEKGIELKVEERKKHSEITEKIQGQYEPSMQKLEAEVRKHIQIEQQMKILIENQQDRITELERGTSNKFDVSSLTKSVFTMPKEQKKAVNEKDKKIADLEAENAALKDQLKASQMEVSKLHASLNGITAIVKRLLG